MANAGRVWIRSLPKQGATISICVDGGSKRVWSKKLDRCVRRTRSLATYARVDRETQTSVVLAPEIKKIPRPNLR
ncbi:hypothetical protein MGG_15782 [Pyricularia oryzae 70-15]|uniref:Uncharacterized protein n=2 Tax=Pyricularia oryzae TaxID=318829 RepID=G4MWL3_PYRO7|nr:uncharacterized protein MGG_15782 [Pyricularia oryzae 70-15]EHA55068.1 hypothetical protein MGG_15782 [Pyricularia oryzae 70-15]KAI7921280.1 hypothetical protein M0657_006147 [Pyricularia oryzae]KAI7924079.1 hypothetical protein M9X92_004040 [Pyricularia oryzae]QBZ56713.1 hypothetical protein PoMZ_01627 [Pyricularia oryzae]